MQCRGGVVVSALACQSEDPRFDYAFGRKFFFSDIPASPLSLQKKKSNKKIGTWVFSRKTEAARAGGGIPTSNAVIS